MSDCKHFWIMPNAPEFVDIICRTCRKPLLAVEANAIINRAQRAEARVKDLEDAIAAALRIKQLWGPPDDVENLLYSGPDDNVADEFRALHSMLTKFEELVK